MEDLEERRNAKRYTLAAVIKDGDIRELYFEEKTSQIETEVTMNVNCKDEASIMSSILRDKLKNLMQGVEA